MCSLTGAGGRDLKGTPSARKNLRTAPQSFDQSFEHNMNASLLVSPNLPTIDRQLTTSNMEREMDADSREVLAGDRNLARRESQ